MPDFPAFAPLSCTPLYTTIRWRWGQSKATGVSRIHWAPLWRVRSPAYAGAVGWPAPPGGRPVDDPAMVAPPTAASLTARRQQERDDTPCLLGQFTASNHRAPLVPVASCTRGPHPVGFVRQSPRRNVAQTGQHARKWARAPLRSVHHSPVRISAPSGARSSLVFVAMPPAMLV